MGRLDLVTDELRSFNTHRPVLNGLKCFISIQDLAKCIPSITSYAWYRTEKIRTRV